jgi:hypothetical protein
LQNGIIVDHIVQYAKLWEMISNLHLELNDTPDEIIWNLSKDGLYSAKSSYNMQFAGLINSKMLALVWKPWPQNARLPLGSSSKTGFERRIGLSRGDGQIMDDASYAIKCKSRPTTFYSNIASPFVCGMS